MDRDEFMELVYETFADEPDNVLANGIIEAADAYAEHEKAQLSHEGTTSDLISRQAAIDALMPIYKSASLRNRNVFSTARKCMAAIEDLPSAQPEPLTDKEQRIFLAAMGREEKVCRQVDDEWRDFREPYEDSLVRVCHEIIRKVKATLWET